MSQNSELMRYLATESPTSPNGNGGAPANPPIDIASFLSVCELTGSMGMTASILIRCVINYCMPNQVFVPMGLSRTEKPLACMPLCNVMTTHMTQRLAGLELNSIGIHFTVFFRSYLCFYQHCAATVSSLTFFPIVKPNHFFRVLKVA